MKLLKFITVFVAVLSITLSMPAAVLAAPGQPGATYPTNGVLLTYPTGPINFQWTSSGTMGTIYYDFEVSTDATFTNPGAFVDSSDGNHTVSGCLNPFKTATNYYSSYAYQPATTYYWRVQAYNNTCNGDWVTGGSGWSIFSFKVSLIAPTGLTVVGYNTFLTPTFEWNSMVNADGYVLQVSTSTAFTSLIVNVTVSYSATCALSTVCYTPPNDLPSHTFLYWRVETLNSTYGPSAWANCGGTTCSFTSATASAAPVPIKYGPSAVYGKVTNDFTPGIRWNAIAIPGGTNFTTYEVEVSTDNTFYDTTATCFDVNSTQIPGLQDLTYQNDPNLDYAQLDSQSALANPGSISYPGANCPTYTSGGILKFQPVNQYYWRVRASTTGGTSDWSTVFSFKTSYPKVLSSSCSTAPALPAYAVTFTWTPVPFPTFYTIEINRSASFNGSMVIHRGGSPTTVYLPGRSIMPDGTTLYWRIRAEGSWGPGLWTDCGSFTTP
jgi:hypothetical protein